MSTRYNYIGDLVINEAAIDVRVPEKGFSKMLTLDSLVEAFISAKEFNDSYSAQQLQILCELFGVDLEKRQDELREEQRLEEWTLESRWYDLNGSVFISFIDRCVETILKVKTPFDYRGLLAGRPPRFVSSRVDMYHPPPAYVYHP